jgi:hypothetical protein
MNSKERMVRTWSGQPADRVPLAAWCFGVAPPRSLRWQRDGREVTYWYSLRLEHIHTLPQPWDLEDDFRRVLAWRSLGVDDVLDVSVPWSVDARVTWQDRVADDEAGPILSREYFFPARGEGPSGSLLHQVRRTGEDRGPGWVIQADTVPLFEDYNIPRAVRHAVSGPADVPAIRYLYQAPDADARAWFAARMERVRAFAGGTPLSPPHGGEGETPLGSLPRGEAVAVQAWSAFGMDAVAWLAGATGAVLLAMDEPHAFGQLVDIVAEADWGRTELAASTPGVDMVVGRGWYASTDFWSPALFERYALPHVRELAALAHRHGKLFAYVMTTGVERLGPRLADAGVDVLYFVDPVQDRLSLERARDLLAGRMTLAGGVSALTLASGDGARIRDEVRRAIEVLGPSGRFVLQPVDALFPDTPWAAVEQLIEAWQAY